MDDQLTKRHVWIAKHFDEKLIKKRLILCHHKQLMIGDYLIDDRSLMEHQNSQVNGFTSEVKNFQIGRVFWNILKFYSEINCITKLN